MNYLVRQLCPMSVNPQLYLFYLNMNYLSKRQNVNDIIHRIYFVTFSKSPWMVVLAELSMAEKANPYQQLVSVSV